MYSWGCYRQPQRRLCSLITSVTSSRIIHSWGAASHVLAHSKKIHQPANVPQLGLVKGNQSESSRRRREGGDEGRRRPLLLPFTPPATSCPVCPPNCRLSLGPRSFSRLLPLILSNTRRQMHHTLRAAALPSQRSKRTTHMKKAPHGGPPRRQFPSHPCLLPALRK